MTTPTSHAKWEVLEPRHRKKSSRTTRVLQGITLVALVPILAFYLYPRVYDLVATPYRLDQAVVHAGRYNPRLAEVVEHEHVTLGAFTALDQMNAAVAKVRAVDAKVASELSLLVEQIRHDLQPILDAAGANVQDLLNSLDSLESRLRELNGPVDDASNTVQQDRANLAAILNEARSTAAKVRTARETADNAARNLSGE